MLHFIKFIPNLITLGNLCMGCVAIILFSQSGFAMWNYDEMAGDYTIRFLSEQLIWGGFFVISAAVLDLFDGLAARALKVQSKLGELLDSLADVVSFGVAPGILLYEMLKYAWASSESNLEVPIILLCPAVLIPCAAAYRLAKFNINILDARASAAHSSGGFAHFSGMPTPAMALGVIALPWARIAIEPIRSIVYNPYALYAVIFLFSWLMVSDYPMYKLSFSMKRKNILFLALLSIVAIAGYALFAYLSLFFTIVVYLILSFLFMPRQAKASKK